MASIPIIKFEKDYARKSEISMPYYRRHFVTLPCRCDADNCVGFAAVSLKKHSILTHAELYMPDKF